MTRRRLILGALLPFLILACDVVQVDPSARYPCPCLTGYECGPDGFCVPTPGPASDGGGGGGGFPEDGGSGWPDGGPDLTDGGCAAPTCEALGLQCGVIDRCGEAVSCGDCADCGWLDPGRCGGCREGEEDLPDEHFHDRNCDGIDGDAAAAVFVDPVAGSDSQDGRSMQTPVRTLGRALVIARGSSDVRQILIGEGTLSSSDSHLVDRTVAIHGRYAPTTGWRRGIDVPRPRIEGSNVAMSQVGTNERTLSGLVLAPSTPSAGGARSSVGLVVEGNLVMWDVRVETSDGRDLSPASSAAQAPQGGGGGVGATPDGGSAGASSCMAQGGRGGRGRLIDGTSAEPGQPSPGGADGGSGAPNFCNNGCANCPGGNGLAGSAGGIGTDGAAGAGPGTWSSRTLVYVDGKPGGAGKQGVGGGGGGGGAACLGMGSNGGGGGGGGAGGCGGAGGAGGASGGHSVGVAVVNGSLRAKDIEIQLGRGGHAGAGAAGAAGGAGGSGAQGGPPNDWAWASQGGYGGQGGTGGRGGHGGGGAGGWAIGVWCANEGELLSPQSEFDVQGGQPGQSGASLGQDGPPGQRHPFYGCAAP